MGRVIIIGVSSITDGRKIIDKINNINKIEDCLVMYRHKILLIYNKILHHFSSCSNFIDVKRIESRIKIINNTLLFVTMWFCK